MSLDLDAIRRRADLPYDVRDPDMELVRSRADVRNLLAEVERLRAELDACQERSIEARNPGIDMDTVRSYRAKRRTVLDQENDHAIQQAKAGWGADQENDT